MWIAGRDSATGVWCHIILWLLFICEIQDSNQVFRPNIFPPGQKIVQSVERKQKQFYWNEKENHPPALARQREQDKRQVG